MPLITLPLAIGRFSHIDYFRYNTIADWLVIFLPL